MDIPSMVLQETVKDYATIVRKHMQKGKEKGKKSSRMIIG